MLFLMYYFSSEPPSMPARVESGNHGQSLVHMPAPLLVRPPMWLFFGRRLIHVICRLPLFTQNLLLAEIYLAAIGDRLHVQYTAPLSYMTCVYNILSLGCVPYPCKL